MIDNFFETYGFGSASLLCCGACGMRQVPSQKRVFKECLLESLPACFKYTEAQKDHLLDMKKRGAIEVPSTSDGTKWKKLEFWKAISFHPQEDFSGDSEIFHLHPELVYDKET